MSNKRLNGMYCLSAAMVIIVLIIGCKTDSALLISESVIMKNNYSSTIMKQDHLIKYNGFYAVADFEFNNFSDKETENTILNRQKQEWMHYGKESNQQVCSVRKYKNTVVLQRSARKRLLDNNIFLAGMFQGMIHYKDKGDLGKAFKDAVFIDIGSAVLCEDGAPTVRAIYEDKKVEPYLSQIVATDINGPGFKYIDKFMERCIYLPFPIREIDMELSTIPQFTKLTEGLLGKDTPIIFRSTNSGPDLYYKPESVGRHFKGLLRTFYNRDVLYFYNKYVLYKSRHNLFFEIIGVDSGIGTSHMADSWDYINWDKRDLKNSFVPNPKYVRIVAPTHIAVR